MPQFQLGTFSCCYSLEVKRYAVTADKVKKKSLNDLLDLQNQSLVCRKPLYGMQCLAGEPCRSLMLIQMHGFGYEGAYKAMHRQMEIRVIPFNRIKQLSHLNLCIQFLTNLTNQGILRAFPTLNLSSREFPSAFKLAISSLSGKYPSFFKDYCCNNFNCFHITQNFQHPS